MDEFLSLVMMSQIKYLFLAKSSGVMLAEPSNMKTRFTLLLVHSVQINRGVEGMGVGFGKSGAHGFESPDVPSYVLLKVSTRFREPLKREHTPFRYEFP